MSQTHALASFTPREAISDTIYCVPSALDRNNLKILNSFCAEDVSMEVRRGEGGNIVMKGLSIIRAQVFDHVGLMDTMHMISYVRVDVKAGSETAFLTAYALAQPCPPGKGTDLGNPKYLVGGQYSIDLVKEQEDQEVGSRYYLPARRCFHHAAF